MSISQRELHYPYHFIVQNISSSPITQCIAGLLEAQHSLISSFTNVYWALTLPGSRFVGRTWETISEVVSHRFLVHPMTVSPWGGYRKYSISNELRTDSLVNSRQPSCCFTGVRGGSLVMFLKTSFYYIDHFAFCFIKNGAYTAGEAKFMYSSE